jgi:hypothetical protein
VNFSDSDDADMKLIERLLDAKRQTPSAPVLASPIPDRILVSATMPSEHDIPYIAETHEAASD